MGTLLLSMNMDLDIAFQPFHESDVIRRSMWLPGLVTALFDLVWLVFMMETTPPRVGRVRPTMPGRPGSKPRSHVVGTGWKTRRGACLRAAISIPRITVCIGAVCPAGRVCGKGGSTMEHINQSGRTPRVRRSVNFSRRAAGSHEPSLLRLADDLRDA